jgi:hypothetical protein
MHIPKINKACESNSCLFPRKRETLTCVPHAYTLAPFPCCFAKYDAAPYAELTTSSMLAFIFIFSNFSMYWDRCFVALLLTYSTFLPRFFNIFKASGTCNVEGDGNKELPKSTNGMHTCGSISRLRYVVILHNKLCLYVYG